VLDKISLVLAVGEAITLLNASELTQARGAYLAAKDEIGRYMQS
jgi:hypothetical protein